ncbi:hypothetical protein AB0A63_19835 [Lentzea sp. NPDC042327]|uniref:hypothetical protein n=1 Tax=Lentzea sp. NPDC042327 TaxID=3154801 RepID=UPI0033BFEEC6
MARDDGLIANACHRLGRVSLRHGQLDEALRYFDLGRLAAARSGDRLSTGVLAVNSAWACAQKGVEHNALTLLDRGREEFGAADRAEVVGWARFLTEPDLSAMGGAVHTVLAGTTHTAVPLLLTAVDGYGEDMLRSRVLSLVLPATGHLVGGDLDVGVATGLRAVESATAVGSARVRDRFRPLAAQARSHPSHAGALDLAHRIDSGTPRRRRERRAAGRGTEVRVPARSCRSTRPPPRGRPQVAAGFGAVRRTSRQSTGSGRRGWTIRPGAARAAQQGARRPGGSGARRAPADRAGRGGRPSAAAGSTWRLHGRRVVATT